MWEHILVYKTKSQGLLEHILEVTPVNELPFISLWFFYLNNELSKVKNTNLGKNVFFAGKIKLVKIFLNPWADN